MSRHAAKSAAQPNSFLKAPSVVFRHSRERKGGCSEPAFYGAFVAMRWLRFGRTSTAGIESLTSVHWGAFRLVSRPLLGHCFGAKTGALRHGVVLLRLRRPSRVSVPPRTSL